MAWLVAAVNVLLLAATGFAAPAPVSVGAWELVLAGALAFAVILAGLGIISGRARLTSRDQLLPLLLLPGLALPVVGSVVMAAARGIPFDAAVRSALPYLAFLPVALLGLLVGPGRRPELVTGPLLFAGVAQSVYVIGLYVFSVADPTDTRAVWLSRITLLDPRTTLPLVLAGAVLPMSAIAAASRWRVKLRWAIPCGLAVTAALSTQTRSQLAAILTGTAAWAVFHTMRRAPRRGPTRRFALVRVALAGLVGLVVAVGVLYLIPHTRALVEAIVLRTQTSLDTGRVTDEWIPALNAMLDNGVAGVLGGIGSGQTFITGSGEERTYVHNVILYGLVYFGVPGLCLILLGYILLVAGLWHRGNVTGDRRYLALAALVVALFVYAQFFAVHKLFSYNLMLVLAAQALVQPSDPAAGRG